MPLCLLPVVSRTSAADGPSAAVKKVLGDKVVAILQKPTKVEAFRIEPRQDDELKGDQQIAGYPIIARAKELDAKFTAKLVAVLHDEKTYNGQSARCFDPGLAFRIWSDKEAVEVIICFRCTNLKVKLMGEEEEAELVLHGFGPEIGPLTRLAKEAFPDDKAIQGLPEKAK